jgi:Cu-Zn family superoxide dismutase
MKKLRIIACLFLTLATTLTVHAKEDMKMTGSEAIAVLYKTGGGNKIGTVDFQQMGQNVQVKVHIEGLQPNSTHGFHVHQYGDLRSEDGKSAGGHFNPEGHEHAGPMTKMRHAGDMGNVKANDKGIVDVTLTFENFKLDPASKDGIIGRSVVLHAGTDDLKSQPSGDAGSRLAVGVIGYAQPAKTMK